MHLCLFVVTLINIVLKVFKKKYPLFFLVVNFIFNIAIGLCLLTHPNSPAVEKLAGLFLLVTIIIIHRFEFSVHRFLQTIQSTHSVFC